MLTLWLFLIDFLKKKNQIVQELVTDLFNPFSLELLSALEHLGESIHVIYVG